MPTSRATRLITAGALLFYAIVAISQWGVAYLDFGDGQYLYVARRVADGLVLYRDVLSPQPPVHTMLGAALLRLGDLMPIPHSVYVVRAYSLLLHCATALLVAAVARRLTALAGMTDDRTLDLTWLGALACYLTIPLGFWWTFGYQTHPTLMFLWMGAFLLLLADSPKLAAGAGAILALTLLTSMTSLPYLALLLLWFLVRRPFRLPFILLPLIGLYVMVAAIFQSWTDGAFLENVVFNQVGSFPKEEITGEPLWMYALRKIATQGAKIIGLEAGYLIMGWIGLFYWGNLAWSAEQRYKYLDFPIIMALAFWGSLVFVSKGATVDYIFTLGEPFICVFAGILLGSLLSRYLLIKNIRTKPNFPLFKSKLIIVTGSLLLLLTAGRSLLFYQSLFAGNQWEQDSEEMKGMISLIEDYSEPGDPILAPPFYAFITDRTVAGEYAEIFLWTIKYMNENQLEENKGLPPGPGTLKIWELAGMLEERSIPLVLLDMNQTGRLPEIQAALGEHYRQIGNPIQTMNTPLGVYIPKRN